MSVRCRGFLVSTEKQASGRILTLHLNYIAGYTDPLLFLFEWTQQLLPLTTRGNLQPWQLRVWAGPEFVRPHR